MPTTFRISRPNDALKSVLKALGFNETPFYKSFRVGNKETSLLFFPAIAAAAIIPCWSAAGSVYEKERINLLTDEDDDDFS